MTYEYVLEYVKNSWGSEIVLDETDVSRTLGYIVYAPERDGEPAHLGMKCRMIGTRIAELLQFEKEFEPLSREFVLAHAVEICRGCMG